MGLTSLVMALGLGLNSTNGLAASATNYKLETESGEPVVTVSTKPNSDLENYFYEQAVKFADEGKYEVAAVNIFNSFRYHPGTDEKIDRKVKACEIFMEYAKIMDKQDNQDQRIWALETLCSYDLSGVPNGYLPAEVLSKIHPNEKKRKEFGKLAKRLKKSVNKK